MFPLDRHLLAAAVAALLVVAAAPLVAWGDGAQPRPAAATSATARAAAVERVASPGRRWPVTGAAVQTAVRIAGAHWGGAACRGEVAMSWTTLAAGTNATASWRNPSHAWDHADENFDCRIELNTGAAFDWDKLCTVVVHELGHLRGRRHDEADHVMAAVYRGPLAACAATAEPGAPAARPAAARPARRAAATRARLRGRAAARARARARAKAQRLARARARSARS